MTFPRLRFFAALSVFFLLSTLEGASQRREEEFQKLAAQVADQRLSGVEEKQSLQDQALALLDDIVLSALNSSSPFDLGALNRQLAGLRPQQPLPGESYRLTLLGGAGKGAVCGLAANFSLSGPSAVRVYAFAEGQFRRRAQIDRFTHKDFFDEYLELVPVSAANDQVFVTVTGRTDDLQTGSFTAWHFSYDRLVPLWSSDLLARSSYAAVPGGFEITYCEESEEDRPRNCRRMLRERYLWDGEAWKRVEQAEVPVPND